jgi:mRNA-degrading endonuclease RelE of RelBE toxin-antitoxin system
MAYQLRFDRRFRRSLEELPGDIRSHARQVIAQLAEVPRPLRSKELDEHPNYYRLWLPRGYRLVWAIIEDEQVIDLLYIGPKTAELYDRLGLGRAFYEADE